MLCYNQAKEWEELTGIPMQVDHIIPLQSENVCGLNVHYNIRAIPEDVNRFKWNKMPKEDNNLISPMNVGT